VSRAADFARFLEALRVCSTVLIVELFGSARRWIIIIEDVARVDLLVSPLAKVERGH
jgi:hypothetical protein